MLTVADLFKMQSTLNERVGLDDKYFAEVFAPGDKDIQEYREALQQSGQWIDDMLKAMANELEELRSCTYWKHWCEEAQRGERYKIKDVEAARKEVIDILHFWISLAQVLGMSPEMVSGMYAAKLAKNIKRQDDGYSIRVKDVAWLLFKEHPTETLKPGDDSWKTVNSFEDLSPVGQDYFLTWAKAELEGADQAEGEEGVQRLVRSLKNES